MRTLAACVVMGMVALSAGAAVQRIRLDEGWKFKRNEWSILERDFPFERMSAWLDDMGRELMETPAPSRRPSRDPGLIHPYTKPDFKDASWRTVRVPHDWGVEDPFSCDLPPEDGCLGMTGVGWYRRTFKVDVPEKGKVFFACDGAMMFAMVWVNGHFAGGWPYGYTSWRVDLTPWLNRTGDNSLVVRVAQTSGTSRWYTGAGLNRDCHLEIMPEDHVVPGSVYITTPQVTKESATVRVRWTMSKGGAKERIFTVAQPRLWDVNDPHLYTVDVEGEADLDGFRWTERTAFNGYLSVLVRAKKGATGPIRVSVSNPELGTAEATVASVAGER